MKEGDFQTAASLEQIKASKRSRSSKGVNVDRSVVERLLKACDTDAGAADRRDAALLTVYLCSGLRRDEARAMDVADYDPATGTLHIRGDRPEYDRLIKLQGPARKIMANWLEARSDVPGPLLLPIDRSGLIQFRRMTSQAVYDILGRIAKRADLPNITSRDLRRAYVVSLIRDGKSLDEVQYLVGHGSWFTTATYRQLAADSSQGSYDIKRLPYKRGRKRRSV